MNEHEGLLFEALKDLDAAVRGMATAPQKPDLIPLFARIDALGSDPTARLDPQLAHYVQRRSYEKALAWFATSPGPK